LARIRAELKAARLALHIQAVSQGTFILANTKGNAAPAQASIDHFRRAGSATFSVGERMRKLYPLHPTPIDYIDARYEGTGS
jgi:hypothetical protein